MKLLPIGIQTFRDIIEGGFYYVDKTHFIPKLTSKYYFLSRPRRFGKSLFLDTLKEAFSGTKELFKGLYLYDNWDWEKRYPVVRLDLSQAYPDTEENLIKSLDSFLKAVAKEHQITLEEEILGLKFKELIQKLYEKYNQKVVVLIDEYDKPILDVIEDIEKARRNRDILKKFFEILKPSDPYLKLVFLTGVSRFSKVSIFSGLNQLNDITVDPSFATVCGYTQSELESVFEDRLKDFDKNKVKEWYNGYAWLGDSVYNPFDILLLFDKKMFKPYWFETATPTFLIKLFMKNQYYIPELENMEVGDEILSNLDVDNIRVENLLFQSGYLTIKDFKEKYGIYTLSYPNLEERKSFNSYFLTYIIEFKVVEDKEEYKALEQVKEKRYYEKYIGKYQEIYLIGIEFSKKDKNIVSFEWERV